MDKKIKAIEKKLAEIENQKNIVYSEEEIAMLCELAARAISCANRGLA